VSSGPTVDELAARAPVAFGLAALWRPLAIGPIIAVAIDDSSAAVRFVEEGGKGLSTPEPPPHDASAVLMITTRIERICRQVPTRFIPDLLGM
jgi:hypothetical protein